MARLLFVITHSTDAPGRAAAALHTAAANLEAGHEVALWLMEEGVRLGVRGVAATLHEPGPGTPAEHLEALRTAGGGIHLSRRCFEIREFDEDVRLEGARLVPPETLGDLVDRGWVPVPA